MTENRVEGNFIRSIDAGDVSYTYEKDELGNLERFTDGGGHDYTFTYNENGLQNSSGFPDGTKSSMVYNDIGLITTIINRDNSTINLSYDEDDNLVSSQHPKFIYAFYQFLNKSSVRLINIFYY